MTTSTVLPIDTIQATSGEFEILDTDAATLTVTGNIYNTTSPVVIYIQKENSIGGWENVLTMGNELPSLILRGLGNYRAFRPLSSIAIGLDLD